MKEDNAEQNGSNGANARPNGVGRAEWERAHGAHKEHHADYAEN